MTVLFCAENCKKPVSVFLFLRGKGDALPGAKQDFFFTGGKGKEHKANLIAFHATLAEPMGLWRYRLMLFLRTFCVQKFKLCVQMVYRFWRLK